MPARLRPSPPGLLPGYSAAANAVVGTDAGTKCVANTYRSGTTTYTSSAISCDACPAGMWTLTGVEGATSPDACLARPGYGWSSGSQTATICAQGTYNPGARRTRGLRPAQRVPCLPRARRRAPLTRLRMRALMDCTKRPPSPASPHAPASPLPHCPVLTHAGWNRQGCVACDSSSGAITTTAQGATSAEQCYIPSGYGSRKTGDGAYTGFICPVNTYGRNADTYGLVEVACEKVRAGPSVDGDLGPRNGAPAQPYAARCAPRELPCSPAHTLLSPPNPPPNPPP